MPRPRNSLRTVQITISTNEQVIKKLEELVRTGFFGKTPAEAAERLITKGIREWLYDEALAVDEAPRRRPPVK